MPLPRKLIRVAWMAVVLGVVMEVVVLLAGASKNAILRDTLSKVAWSSIVCFGVAVGAGASAKLRAPLMGVAGLLAAPAAFATARVVHKAFTFATGSAAGDRIGIVLLLATMKAAEYAAFGMLTGWLAGTAAGGKGSPLPIVINELLFPAGCALVLFASRLLTADEATLNSAGT